MTHPDDVTDDHNEPGDLVSGDPLLGGDQDEVVPSGSGVIYFVRPDGGDASQCTGRANAPYPGTGSNQPCAWSHPMIALPSGQQARIASGDTLYVAHGSYMVGLGAPGSDGNASCIQAYAWDCVMAGLPSGLDALRPTRLLGEGFASGCTMPPEFWGTERVDYVIGLSNVSNVEIACLEITDHSDCIEFHCAAGGCPNASEIAACVRDLDVAHTNFGPWASDGIWLNAVTGVALRDLNIHGFGYAGIVTQQVADLTLQRTTLRANGWFGYVSNDVGTYATGTIGIHQSRFLQNGCGERYPSGTVFGCWSSTGGYGRAFNLPHDGATVVVEDTQVIGSSHSGMEFVARNGTGNITIRRSWFEANAGVALTLAGVARVENSVFVGNCGAYAGQGEMLPIDLCYGGGNVLNYSSAASGVAEQFSFVNNTIISEGQLALGVTASAEDAITVANTIMIGEPQFGGGGALASGYYVTGSPQQDLHNNIFFTDQNSPCQGGDSLCPLDPLLLSDDFISFDPGLTGSSPAIDQGDAAVAPSDDFYGNPRPLGDGVDVGAIEQQ